MKTGYIRAFMVATLLSCSLLASARAADNETRGTVSETGFGKFSIQDKDNSNWLYYVAKDSTSFDPNDWRPAVGDKVTVSHVAVTKRGSTISQAVKVTLDKAGPNTLDVKSPVSAEIIEVGRSGVQAKLSDGHVVRFDKQRSTQILPVGWQPAPGEKVTLTFVNKPATFGFGIGHYLVKVEKK
jgi:hypothetical protein